jgi:hypothetical protein
LGGSQPDDSLAGSIIPENDKVNDPFWPVQGRIQRGVQTVATRRKKGTSSRWLQRTIDEADIRQQIDRLVNEIRAMDLEDLMSIYARDIVSFDIVPPLWYVAAKTKSEHFGGTSFRCTKLR